MGAIEGAVGSIQKVDATYLSPHVNMAARLETSSKQFGTPLLFSQALFDLLSPEVQDCCRRLDVVTVKGSEQPIGVFTYDCRQDQIFKTRPPVVPRSKSVAASKPDAARVTRKPSQKKIREGQVAPAKVAAESQRSSVTDIPKSSSNITHEHHSFDFYQNKADSDLEFCQPDQDTAEVMECDCDLVYLRRHVTAEFYDTHRKAVELYLQGDWSNARVGLESCNEMMKKIDSFENGDGPSLVLLNYMANRDWTAPKDWKGFRPLTSK